MSKKVILIVVLSIFGLAILVGGAYGGIKYYQKKLDEKKTSENKSVSSPDSVSTVNPNNTTSNQNPGNTHADWLTYSNASAGYMISYPSGAKVEDAGNPKANDIAHSKCIKISTDNYYAIVGAVDFAANCFVAKTGDDWLTGPTENPTPAGASYTVTGMHREAASAGYYDDYFTIPLLDGVNKIEYGISVNEKYGTMTKTAAKKIVQDIVASYNPAE